jgi:hypothetical protein
MNALLEDADDEKMEKKDTMNALLEDLEAEIKNLKTNQSIFTKLR